MGKLLSFLKDAKKAVALIMLLLIIQAACELALPQYTADIVDIGIQQGGIADAVPEALAPEILETLCAFLPADEAALLRQRYTVDGQGYLVLTASSDETRQRLAAALTGPMAYLATEPVPDLTLSQNQLLQLAEDALANDSAAIIQQKALLFVKNHYIALGFDLGEMQTSYLLSVGAKMLLFSVIMMAAAILVNLLAARTAAGIGMRLRGQVFSKVMAFSSGEMDRYSTASLITRSTNDIQQVQMVTVMLLRMVVYSPILAIGGIIKVAGTKTGMGWIIVVAVVVICLVVLLLNLVAMPKFKKMQSLIDQLNLIARETLTGLPVIRAFGREAHEEGRFYQANEALTRTQLFANRTMSFMMPSMMLIMNGITVLIVWMSAQGMALGQLQVGDMMAFMTYTMQIIMSFLMLTMVSVMLPRAGVAADRINEVLTTPLTVTDKAQVRDEALAHCRGAVQFHDVAFRYPDAEGDVLRHISFTALPGQTTAIIGGTGCGKSTLLNLIPRFYDVTAGSITIDGVDIRDLSQQKLRSLLGYVPQKSVLFSGDIASNLKFGGDTISDSDMAAAAAIAQPADFITATAEGYHSPTAQGGSNLSGGQKQRLSIARAIAKKPKIFLFDDSFSALDYKTDSALRRALSEKLTGATIIIVAQRISTILHADQIIVLNDGQIAGIGSHEALLADCGIYQEIARSQLSEQELKGGAARE